EPVPDARLALHRDADGLLWRLDRLPGADAIAVLVPPEQAVRAHLPQLDEPSPRLPVRHGALSPRRAPRSDDGRQQEPPRGVGRPSALRAEQMSAGRSPARRIVRMRSASSGATSRGLPSRVPRLRASASAALVLAEIRSA